MERKEYIFKRDEHNLPLLVDVYFTKSVPNSGHREKSPIAIALHGGGFVIGSKEMIPQSQVMKLVQDFGFIVVAPNYRLCPTISVYDGPLVDAKDAYNWSQMELPGLLRDEENLNVDPQKIVAFGYSAGATLALLLAAMPNPPLAILDFYGPKFFSSDFWSSPLPALAHFPHFEETFVSQIYNENPPSFTSTSLERSSPGGGMPRLDFSLARNAWLFTAMKHGYHLQSVVRDNLFDRVDPSKLFSKNFPPTCFIHGTADTLVDFKFSEDAFQSLNGCGVESKLVAVSNMGHGFDKELDQGNPLFSPILIGLEFLANHV